MTLLFKDWIDSGATFSDDRVYRYRLWRLWSEIEPVVGFCMLNPSTADETKDDPTIRRCIGFAQKWGYGGIVIVNLFALRSTDPKALYSHADPIGPDNDAWIANERQRCVEMIAAWGNHGAFNDRGNIVRKLFAMKTLGITGSGQPRHPLYLPGDTVPENPSV